MIIGWALALLAVGCALAFWFVVRGAHRVRHAPRWHQVLRSIPFTYAVLGLMLAAGLVSGGLWKPAIDQPWWPDYAYGLTAFADGRWWSLVTGTLLTQEPGHYFPLLVGMALFLSWTEWHFGTLRTAAMCVLGQLGAVLGAAALLALLEPTGWAWAVDRAPELDAGFSAGLLACMTVVGSAARAPWRMRVRLGLLAYVLLTLLYVGGVADLEHFLAVVVALVLTRDRLRIAATVQQWRELALVGLVVLAARPLLTWSSIDSPLGTAVFADGDHRHAVVAALVIVLLAVGVWRGLRVAWWATVVLALFYVVGGLATTVHLVVRHDRVETPGLAIGSALLWAVQLLVLWNGRGAFRVPLRRRALAQPGGSGQLDVVAELSRFGGGSLSWMTTWRANSYLRLPGGGYIAYQEHLGVAIGLADPVCAPDGRGTAMRLFTDAAEAAGLTPCLFSVGAAAAREGEAFGWRSVEIAQDTIVDLPQLELRGKKWQDVRTALNHAKKLDIRFELAPLAARDHAVRTRIWQISQEWVGDKGLPEMGFTLGGLDQARDPHVLMGVAIGADGAVHGFTSWLPVLAPGGAPRGWTLDLMRHADDAVKSVMEFLIGSACLAFKERGAGYVSLSGAPLASSGSDPSALGRLLERTSRLLEPLYGFQSLEAFKAKFSPRTEPMYLLFRDEADLPAIALGVARAYLPTASPRDLAAALRPARRAEPAPRPGAGR